MRAPTRRSAPVHTSLVFFGCLSVVVCDLVGRVLAAVGRALERAIDRRRGLLGLAADLLQFAGVADVPDLDDVFL
jgi:hypothetical protein